MAEMSLPEGWVCSNLEESISCSGLISDGDWVESKDQDPKGSIRLIQLADVGDGEFRNRSDRFMTTEQAERLNCTFLRDGDILVARMPDPLGRACIFPELHQKAVTVVDICLIRTGNTSAIINRLLMYWINSPSFRDEIQINATGTTRKRITRKKLEQLPFPLPPLAEQKVIADQLDSLLAQVERTKARLERIPTLMKQFRQSVLADTVSGKLTEGWREGNFTSDINVTLDKIKESNTHKPKPYEFSFPPFEIHSSWSWCRLGDVFILKSGKTVDDSEQLNIGEVPYFKVADMNHVENQFLMNHAEKFVAGNTKSLLPKNSIIFPKRGGAIATNKKRILTKESLVDLNTMGIIVPFGLDMMYVFRWFETIDLAELNTGSTIPQINNSDIEPLWIPIPPLEEQSEIVRRVETLFAHADSIEQQAKTGLERVNKLTQSILAKAFRGELTAQWRKDHPDLISGENSVQALLERIKAERTEMGGKKSRKRAE
jgi:type I restriction enzyme S subunit